MVIIWKEKSEYSDISLLIRYIRIIHTCIYTFLKRAASLSVWYKLKLHRYYYGCGQMLILLFFFILMEKTKLNIYMIYRRTLNYIEWSMKLLWVYNESDK